jgi:hypothetical protein
LNGDGVVNDRDIPVAVGIHSTAPIIPVPIPSITNNYTGLYAQDDWQRLPQASRSTSVCAGSTTPMPPGQSAAHQPCPSLNRRSHFALHMDGERPSPPQVS